MFFRSIFYFCLLVSVLCFLCLWNFWIKKLKIALITSFILLLMYWSELLKKSKNDNDVTVYQHDIIVKLFWRSRISLVKYSYWFKFHVNIISRFRVITIFTLKKLTRNPEIANTTVWILANIRRLGKVRYTKFGTVVSNKKLLNATNC